MTSKRSTVSNTTGGSKEDRSEDLPTALPCAGTIAAADSRMVELIGRASRETVGEELEQRQERISKRFCCKQSKEGDGSCLEC